MIKPRLTMDSRQREKFVAVTREQAAAAAKKELQIIGERWVAEVRKIVSEELPRRSGHRHKANTTHLEESFTYRIEGDDFPFELVLTIKPGVSAGKIASLNYGAKGNRTIRAVRSQYLRWGDEPGMLHAPFQTEVIWKPDGPDADPRTVSGYRFMERALQEALKGRIGARFG